MTTVQDNPPAIMIVEDDERLADLTCEYLQANGLDVTVVSDGEEAIRRIRAEQPDLVVLDLMLPGADGLTVCREVRSAYKNPILMHDGWRVILNRCHPVLILLGILSLLSFCAVPNPATVTNVSLRHVYTHPHSPRQPAGRL